jgi:hypothetical protein
MGEGMTNGWGSKKKGAGGRGKLGKTKIGTTKRARRTPASAVQHQDLRYPVHGDPNQEMLCKWIAAADGYECRQVKKGGDWEP